MDALSTHYKSPGRLADYRRQFERTTRKAGEDPSIFATALETLAVKAFGDMGQTARLRLIRDRFIAVIAVVSCGGTWTVCHLRLLYGTWWIVAASGNHADPAVCQVSKPSPDPIYPAYVVGDSDKISETTRVAAVTRPKSGPDQLEIQLLLAAVDTPALVSGSACSREVATASGGGDTESSDAGHESSGVGEIGEDAPVVPLWTTASEAATSAATHPTGLEWSCLFLMREVGSYCDSVARLWMSRFRLCCQDSGRRKLQRVLL